MGITTAGIIRIRRWEYFSTAVKRPQLFLPRELRDEDGGKLYTFLSIFQELGQTNIGQRVL